MRVVDAGQLRAALSMTAAIDALETAFRDDDPDAAAPLRSTFETARGSLLVMPARGSEGVGVKLVTLSPANPARRMPLIHAVYVLFDPETQTPEAVFDGGALTALRTAAVSGLATRHLANPSAERLVLFGAGVQATAHLEAMAVVRSLRTVVLVSRNRERAEALAANARAMGLEGSVGSPGAVADADLVCTCTTATSPVFEGRLLADGAHVNAIGAYLPDTRELDTDTIRRARVVVETRAVAFAEAGDLLIPIAQGSVAAEHVAADLGELVRGAGVRATARDVTVFTSVGMGFEDIVVARAAVEAGA
jgi:ornithine cyclodeaminase/alanine dehydrogenase-like protein (mu-crystallin family)